MAQIHSTAIIGKNVELNDNVEIGPFCIIEGNVKIDSGTKLYNNVVIKTQNDDSYIKIGKNNNFFSFSVIGSTPQDYKFKNEPSNVEIGDNNIIREYTTINGGSNVGNKIANNKNLTKICNNCCLYISSHVAHDVYLEDNVVLTNYAGISGHCKIDHDTIIGGLTGIHQFVHIGHNVMIGMCCSISNDIPPYAIVSSNKDKISGTNIIGLKRHGFNNKDIHLINDFYNDLIEKNILINDILKKYQDINNDKINDILEFIKNQSNRRIFL